MIPQLVCVPHESHEPPGGAVHLVELYMRAWTCQVIAFAPAAGITTSQQLLQ